VEVGKDTIAHSPAKVVHGWYNESDKPLRIMVAKTPKPKSPQFCYSLILVSISFLILNLENSTKSCDIRNCKFRKLV